MSRRCISRPAVSRTARGAAMAAEGRGGGDRGATAAAAWAALWAGGAGGAPALGLAAAAGGAGLVAAGRLLGGRERRLRRVACRPGRLADVKALGLKLPAVVAARGRVCCSQPLRLQPEGAGPRAAEEAGCLLRTCVENFYMKSGLGGQWERESVVLADHTAEAAWWLWDFSGMRLPVVGAAKADWLELAKVRESFEPVGVGASPPHSQVVRSSLDYLRGLKLLGTRTQQHMLRVGEEVTVVGELAWEDPAVLADRGAERAGGGAPAGGAGQRGFDWEGWKGNPERLVLRRPAAAGSLPFIITKKPFEELIQELGFWARRCTLLGLCVGGAGLALFGFNVFRAVQRARREALFRRRMFEAHQRLEEAVAGKEADSAGPGGAVGDAYPELCVVCLEKPYDTVFLRCGHLCCCSACVGRVKNKCPICRTWSKTIKTFRP